MTKKSFSIMRVLMGIGACILISLIIVMFPNHDPALSHMLIRQAELHELSIGFFTYKADHSSYLSSNGWCDQIGIYFADAEILLNHEFDLSLCGYAMNKNIPAKTETLPSDLVVFFESTPGRNQVGDARNVLIKQGEKLGAYIMFANGDIRFVNAKEIPGLRWTVEDKSVERE